MLQSWLCVECHSLRLMLEKSECLYSSCVFSGYRVVKPLPRFVYHRTRRLPLVSAEVCCCFYSEVNVPWKYDFFLFLKNNQISLWAVACGSRYMTNIIKMSPPTTLPHTCCHAISLYLQFGIFDLCHCCEYPSLFSCLRAVAGGKLGGTTTTRKQQLVCCARRRILYIIYDVVSLCIDFLLFHSSMLQ
jgi:hypothetical protein